MIECWRIHPELMENKTEGQSVANDVVVDGNKEKGMETAPLMILSSGKVFGNLGAQWKEVRDNQGKGKEK